VLRYFARTAMFRLRVPEQILAALMLSPLATPSLVSALTVALQKVQPEVLAHRMRQVLSVDDRATVRDLTTPVVYLRGTLDRLVPDSAVSVVAQAAASFHLAQIAAPHALLQTAPAAAWLGINVALARCGLTSR
jgi:sigma-B regulation protein RsbQ